MANNGFIAVFDKQGITWNRVLPEVVEPDIIYWIHLKSVDEKVLKWIQSHGLANELVCKMLTGQQSRPRFKSCDGIFAGAVRGVVEVENSSEHLVSLKLIYSQNLLITFCEKPIKAVSNVVRRFKNGSVELVCGTKTLITQLLEAITGNIARQIITMEEELAGLEESFIDEEQDLSKKELLMFRMRLVQLRRFLSPQKEAFNFFWREVGGFDKVEVALLQEVGERNARLLDDLDQLRERTSILQEDLVSSYNELTNKRMYLLAVVTTIFLPLGFLTGLFGINIGGMPGVENKSAFMFFTIGLLITAAGITALLKKYKWF